MEETKTATDAASLIVAHVDEPEKKYKRNYRIKKQRHFYSPFIVGLFGSIAIVIWILLFSLGMLIDSGPYRNALTVNFNFPDFFMTVISYTPQISQCFASPHRFAVVAEVCL